VSQPQPNQAEALQPWQRFLLWEIVMPKIIRISTFFSYSSAVVAGNFDADCLVMIDGVAYIN
jgi:hypothetical protein